MKKILFVLEGYPATARSTDLCVANVINEIRKEYKVVCIAQQKRDLSEFEEIDGLKTYRLSGRKL